MSCPSTRSLLLKTINKLSIVNSILQERYDDYLDNSRASRQREISLRILYGLDIPLKAKVSAYGEQTVGGGWQRSANVNITLEVPSKYFAYITTQFLLKKGSRTSLRRRNAEDGYDNVSRYQTRLRDRHQVSPSLKILCHTQNSIAPSYLQRPELATNR